MHFVPNWDLETAFGDKISILTKSTLWWEFDVSLWFMSTGLWFRMLVWNAGIKQILKLCYCSVNVAPLKLP